MEQVSPPRIPWNKGKLTGAKPPLRLKHVWSIRSNLQIEGRTRDLAMFNLAIDSKLRGCDVVNLRVEDIAPHGHAVDRATNRQRKTGIPVKFELTEQTREAVDAYLKSSGKKPGEFLFSGRGGVQAMTTRNYARLVSEWINSIGLDARFFGTHSLRRTKATLIYRRTGNLRAVQLLLGHRKIDYVPCRTMSHHRRIGGLAWRWPRRALDIAILPAGHLRPRGEHHGTNVCERRGSCWPRHPGLFRCRPRVEVAGPRQDHPS